MQNSNPLYSFSDYPFGMLMPGRNSDSTYWFGFNGKENLNDIKGKGKIQDFGDRIYDSRLGRWMAIDPSFDKYPFFSPYHAFGNNPILFVDIKGRDNVIYLVTLPDGKSTITKQDAIDIAAKANSNFEAMGLKTRVVVFPGTNFNTEFMDNTDMVAVIGNPAAVKNYVKDQLKNPDFSKEVAAEMSDGASEVSENVNGPDGGNIITVNTDKLNETSKNFHVSSNEAAAFLINHGAGHNSGFNHFTNKRGKFAGIGADVMQDGGTIFGILNPGRLTTSELRPPGTYTTFPANPNFKTLKDFMTLKGNTKYAESMKSTFGNNNSTVNYGPKDKKCEVADQF